jgi:hypothetical protein
LEKNLLDLSDLPLAISGVQGCSPVLRYADVFPPVGRLCRADGTSVVVGKYHLRFVEGAPVKEMPLYHEPIEMVLQMSASGKWPDDVEALRMTKAAFYIQIADCLRKQCKLSAHGSMHHVDVIKVSRALTRPFHTVFMLYTRTVARTINGTKRTFHSEFPPLNGHIIRHSMLPPFVVSYNFL